MAKRLDGITSYLKQSYQPSALDSAMLQRSLRTTGPTVTRSQDAVAPSMYGTIPDVGQFGTSGSLPTNPGPVDPPILTGNYPTAGPNVGPTRSDIWTRMDPNMGYLNPSLNIDPSSGSGPTSYGGPSAGGISFDPSGALQGGNRGPQGSVYGTDPNTGQPIYNVTGSPRPGFFDSRTGKFVEGIGAGALNLVAPGAGLVAKLLFDLGRKGVNAHHTGTDLTGKNQTPPVAPPAGGGMQGPPSIPASGALLGYRPSEGGGTPHFDFTRGGYTTTVPGNPLYSTGGNWMPVSGASSDVRFAQNSGTGNWVADQTTKDFLAAGGYKGTPNKAMPDSRNQFTPGSGFIGQIDQDTGLLQRVSGPTVKPFVATNQSGPALTTNPNSLAGYNAAIMQQPGYQAYMQRLAALKQGG